MGQAVGAVATFGQISGVIQYSRSGHRDAGLIGGFPKARIQRNPSVPDVVDLGATIMAIRDTGFNPNMDKPNTCRACAIWIEANTRVTPLC